MEILSGALSFAALVFLGAGVAGTIHPAWFKDKKTGAIPPRAQMGCAGLFAAGLLAVIAGIVSPEKTVPPPPKPVAAHEQKPDKALPVPWLKPETIVRFPKSGIACLNQDDLQQVMVLGVSGHGTKMKSYFTGQDGDGPRCLMLSTIMNFKVIDVQANSSEMPDALLLEIVDADVDASEHGAFTIALDKSLVQVIKAPN